MCGTTMRGRRGGRDPSGAVPLRVNRLFTAESALPQLEALLSAPPVRRSAFGLGPAHHACGQRAKQARHESSAVRPGHGHDNRSDLDVRAVTLLRLTSTPAFSLVWRTQAECDGFQRSWHA